MAGFVVYAAPGPRNVQIGVSGDPVSLATYVSERPDRKAGGRQRVTDESSSSQLIVLTNPLSFRVAADIAEHIVRIKWWQAYAWPPFLRLAALRAIAWPLIKQAGGRPFWQSVWPDENIALLPGELDKARDWLAGRCLLHSEAVQLLEHGGEGELTGDPVACIEVLAWNGFVVQRSALTRSLAGRWHCHRCGARDEVDVGYCVHCGADDCASCTECAALGVARACQPVIIGLQPVSSGKGQTLEEEPGTLMHLPFSLSPAQQRASEKLLAEMRPRSLVWAACGAGKTEVVYGVMEQALLRGDNVLFAVPRRDIAAELTERIAEAFPTVHCHGLYGGVVEKFSNAQCVVATTHQVLRFYERFPLVIVDEVDAFPYRGSAMLRRGVERALTPDGRLVYMTATPTEALLQRATTNGWTLLTIPSRHHGQPLPVPQFVLEPAMGALRQTLNAQPGDAVVPPVLAKAIYELAATRKPLLVFVPTVRLVEPTVLLLQHLLENTGGDQHVACSTTVDVPPAGSAAPGESQPRQHRASITVAGTHARDPHRDRRRVALQKGSLSVLVATTILERGVTIPGVNVIVLFANDARLFDSATLIQMAGRAGRTTDSPHGHVLFCASAASPSMVRARSRIQQLNEEAARQGFLLPGKE